MCRMAQTSDVHSILPDIEAFLSETGLAASTFGQRAAGDWKLVDRLRAGGDIRRATERRIRAFLADPASRKIVPRRAADEAA